MKFGKQRECFGKGKTPECPGSEQEALNFRNTKQPSINNGKKTKQVKWTQKAK